MNDLSSFIEAQRAAGSFESAGSFTLALEKAVEKLSSHSLANPEEYLLKLVQCAVRLRVPEIHVKLLKRSALVFFETAADDRTVSVDLLSQALASPLEESNPARSYLALALCAVASQEPKELLWGEWDDRGEGTVLSLSERRPEVFHQAPFPRVEPLAPGRRFYLFYTSKPPIGLPLSQMSAEHAILTRRCAFTPMPLILDGRPLGPSLPLQFTVADPLSELTSPYLGALDLVSQEPNSLRWPAVPASKSKWRPANLPAGLVELSPSLPPVYRLRTPRGFSVPMTDEAKIHELYGVPIHLYGCSYLHYVKDGVLLAPVRVHDSGGGAFAILDGDQRKTDLTGLQVVLDDQVAEDSARLTELWKIQIERMLSKPPPIYNNRPLYARQSTAITAMGCCFLGPLGLLAGPLYSLFQSRQGKQRQLQRQLVRQLETRRGYLTFLRR